MPLALNLTLEEKKFIDALSQNRSIKNDIKKIGLRKNINISFNQIFENSANIIKDLNIYNFSEDRIVLLTNLFAKYIGPTPMVHMLPGGMLGDWIPGDTNRGSKNTKSLTYSDFKSYIVNTPNGHDIYFKFSSKKSKLEIKLGYIDSTCSLQICNFVGYNGETFTQAESTEYEDSWKKNIPTDKDGIWHTKQSFVDLFFPFYEKEKDGKQKPEKDFPKIIHLHPIKDGRQGKGFTTVVISTESTLSSDSRITYFDNGGTCCPRIQL